jgi:hypothetical protein
MSNSDTSVSRSIAESLILKHPTLGLGNSFEFKLKDSMGHFHRFKCGMPRFGVGFPCKENLSQFEAKPVEHGCLENFRNREPGRVIFHDSTAV